MLEFSAKRMSFILENNKKIGFYLSALEYFEGFEFSRYVHLELRNNCEVLYALGCSIWLQ